MSYRDPAFTENRTVPLHRWLPWIAGLSAKFVDDAIRAFVPARKSGRSLVLDPFAGVDTTLLQAVQLGFHARTPFFSKSIEPQNWFLRPSRRAHGHHAR
jgi:hypothetical protein